MKIDKRFNFRCRQQGVLHREERSLMQISVQCNRNEQTLDAS